MHDIADLESRGTVGVFVASEQFVEAARVQGEALGFPAPLVVVPHPVQDRSDAEVRAYADDALGPLLRALTSG